MNVRQPANMWNYTNMGFRLVKLPPRMSKTLTKFWKDNKGKEVEDAWFEGNTYANHWKAPTAMLDVSDSKLKGGGEKLVDLIWGHDSTHAGGMDRAGTDQDFSLRNSKVHHQFCIGTARGSNAPGDEHGDNEAHNAKKPWIMELWGHDGKAYNVTMEVGDTPMYESHS